MRESHSKASIINGFGARMEPESWGEGIYFLADYWRTAIVVIHHLPRTELTLWLRLFANAHLLLNRLQRYIFKAVG